MKSERQQNQESDLLADKIESYLVKLRDALPAILAVTAIVVVGLICYGFYSSVRSAHAAQAWGALYFSDSDPTDLDGIADEFNATPAGLWALQISGDSHLAKALESVYSNRDVADKHYENAVAEYEKVARSAKEGLLQSRAYFGLAQSYEGLAKRDEAIANYRKVAGIRIADTTFKDICAKRAEWLESKDGETFIDYYRTNRQAAPAIAPPTGIKPEIPSAPTSEFLNLPQSPAETASEESVTVEAPSATDAKDTPTPDEQPAPPAESKPNAPEAPESPKP